MLNVDNSPYLSPICRGGHCTAGACGQSCSQNCTVSPGDEFNPDCEYSCDPTPDPGASNRVTWFVIGGVVGPIGLGMVCMVGCLIYYGHYKNPNGYNRLN